MKLFIVIALAVVSQCEGGLTKCEMIEELIKRGIPRDAMKGCGIERRGGATAQGAGYKALREQVSNLKSQKPSLGDFKTQKIGRCINLAQGAGNATTGPVKSTRNRKWMRRCMIVEEAREVCQFRVK
ncbi:hypothetical protein RR46_14150 [Papilio xuthus]|uniref:Uncharacterized protein n=1 Tax=Papilio xuthus TaxID=66420 RepID=A0A194PJM8_PAPXU|nr:hypothetical protein RR46_14150 [Papilio xuthus]